MLKENNPNKLTIKDVRDKLSGWVDRIREQITNNKMDPSPTKQVCQSMYFKQCKGYCGKDGEYGHHSRTCLHNKAYRFRFQVGNNKSGATWYYCGEKGHYMRDFQAKKKAGMIKMSKAKEFEKGAADEEQY